MSPKKSNGLFIVSSPSVLFLAYSLTYILTYLLNFLNNSPDKRTNRRIRRKKNTFCQRYLIRCLFTVGVPDKGGVVCGESGVVLLAFRHPAGHLRCLLLEDHLGAPT